MTVTIDFNQIEAAAVDAAIEEYLMDELVRQLVLSGVADAMAPATAREYRFCPDEESGRAAAFTLVTTLAAAP